METIYLKWCSHGSYINIPHQPDIICRKNEQQKTGRAQQTQDSGEVIVLVQAISSGPWHGAGESELESIDLMLARDRMMREQWFGGTVLREKVVQWVLEQNPESLSTYEYG